MRHETPIELSIRTHAKSEQQIIFMPYSVRTCTVLAEMHPAQWVTLHNI